MTPWKYYYDTLIIIFTYIGWIEIITHIEWTNYTTHKGLRTWLRTGLRTWTTHTLTTLHIIWLIYMNLREMKHGSIKVRTLLVEKIDNDGILINYYSFLFIYFIFLTNFRWLNNILQTLTTNYQSSVVRSNNQNI